MAQDKPEDQVRSKDALEMDELLKKSAEMKARHQITREKGEELKQRTDDFLSEQPGDEPA